LYLLDLDVWKKLNGTTKNHDFSLKMNSELGLISQIDLASSILDIINKRDKLRLPQNVFAFVLNNWVN
jgi:hypothetical protein